ncbi:MAG: hypothetical protein ACRC37_04135, partial [Lentisphaeria bacterium]
FFSLPNTGDIYSAWCPIIIQNQDVEALKINKIYINPPHLHLYGLGDRFVTNLLYISYKGREQSDHVSYLGLEKEDKVGEFRLVSNPRQAMGHNFLVKSLEIFSSFEK